MRVTHIHNTNAHIRIESLATRSLTQPNQPDDSPLSASKEFKSVQF
jgi:hypothetical protein